MAWNCKECGVWREADEEKVGDRFCSKDCKDKWDGYLHRQIRRGPPTAPLYMQRIESIESIFVAPEDVVPIGVDAGICPECHQRLPTD